MVGERDRPDEGADEAPRSGDGAGGGDSTPVAEPKYPHGSDRRRKLGNKCWAGVHESDDCDFYCECICHW